MSNTSSLLLIDKQIMNPLLEREKKQNNNFFLKLEYHAQLGTSLASALRGIGVLPSDGSALSSKHKRLIRGVKYTPHSDVSRKAVIMSGNKLTRKITGARKAGRGRTLVHHDAPLIHYYLLDGGENKWITVYY